MVYAVIDTNILVSSRISKNPLAATVKVVANVFQNRIIPVFNEEILSEYYEVLHRPKFRISEEQINAILEYIKKCGVHSERIPFDGDMPDEDDRVFYEVSLSKEDSFLVTGNLKHFPKTPKVITAAQMMEILDNRVGGKRSSFSPTFVFRPLTPPYVRFRIRRFLFWVPFDV